jgi:hypothetical protein
LTAGEEVWNDAQAMSIAMRALIALVTFVCRLAPQHAKARTPHSSIF